MQYIDGIPFKRKSAVGFWGDCTVSGMKHRKNLAEDEAVRIREELEKIALPQKYRRNGRICFLDPYRKRLIEVTPEETVRQRVAKYCEEVLGAPAEYMMLEVPMSKYGKEARGRADIVIHQKASDDILYPLAVVECKQPDVMLTDRVADQAAGYCDRIGADYFLITNGVDLEFFKYIEEKDTYQKLGKGLSYKEMVSGSGTFLSAEEKPPRFTLEQMQDLELMREYSEADVWVFGGDTPARFIPFAVNLYQALLDEDHRLPAAGFRNYEMTEDLGVRYYDYSNGGGGHFNGLFRAFLIKDADGESQIMSFSIFGVGGSMKYDRANANRTSYTTLFVAIDKFKVSKSILEYNVDTFVNISEGKATFRHNGRISSMPSGKLRDYIEGNSELIRTEGDELNLGQIPTNRLLYLDGQEESILIYTFLEYALLREKFRNQRKRRAEEAEIWTDKQ